MKREVILFQIYFLAAKKGKEKVAMKIYKIGDKLIAQKWANSPIKIDGKISFPSNRIEPDRGFYIIEICGENPRKTVWFYRVIDKATKENVKRHFTIKEGCYSYYGFNGEYTGKTDENFDFPVNIANDEPILAHIPKDRMSTGIIVGLNKIVWFNASYITVEDFIPNNFGYELSRVTFLDPKDQEKVTIARQKIIIELKQKLGYDENLIMPERIFPLKVGNTYWYNNKKDELDGCSEAKMVLPEGTKYIDDGFGIYFDVSHYMRINYSWPEHNDIRSSGVLDIFINVKAQEYIKEGYAIYKAIADPSQVTELKEKIGVIQDYPYIIAVKEGGEK